MKLRISEITLKNFKTFKNLTINPNPDFNIVIGENSSGKSTIFEAIHLWEKCYKTYILSSRKGFYKVKKSTNRYVNYQDLDFLRITKDEDLFFDPKDDELGKCAEITISLTNDDEELTWSLGFKITCPTSIENAFYRVQPISEADFADFAEKFCATDRFLDEAIFIYQTRPVAGIHQFEPYYNEAQIKRKIQKGASHEVLRNKIVVKRRSIPQLEESISSILEKEVKFRLPPIARREKGEYIDLLVSINGSKPYDLHLQGSGFLQIVEILATIEFIDAPLKLLLVDEPDSHIHSKLQRKLISHLKSIDHNQFFVISHNDQFVTNAGDGEIFFLNEEVKEEGILKPIDTESFDIIKNSLGGVIMSLELLNQSKSIVFVEGNDDAEYISTLHKKIAEMDVIARPISEITFFPLRGKDNIVQKIEYNKRTLSTLLKGKQWKVLFDQDFSTQEIDQRLKNLILGKRCQPFSHQGYCIESVLFTEINILKRFIKSLVCNLDEEVVDHSIEQVLIEIETAVKNLTHDLNKQIELSFHGQKNNRPEFEGIEFIDVMRSWSESNCFKYERLMSKPLIQEFIIRLEEKLQQSLFIRSSNNAEELSSTLLLLYFDFIQDLSDVFPSFKALLTHLELFEEQRARQVA